MASLPSEIRPDEAVKSFDKNNEVCTRKDSEETNAIASKSDEYSYTRTDQFTSEIYKIEIGNLPKIYSVNHLKKLLLKLKLQPKKVKVIPKVNYAFVTFKCDEDRQVRLGEELQVLLAQSAVAKQI